VIRDLLTRLKLSDPVYGWPGTRTHIRILLMWVIYNKLPKWSRKLFPKSLRYGYRDYHSSWVVPGYTESFDLDEYNIQKRHMISCYEEKLAASKIKHGSLEEETATFWAKIYVCLHNQKTDKTWDVSEVVEPCLLHRLPSRCNVAISPATVMRFGEYTYNANNPGICIELASIQGGDEDTIKADALRLAGALKNMLHMCTVPVIMPRETIVLKTPPNSEDPFEGHEIVKARTREAKILLDEEKNDELSAK